MITYNDIYEAARKERYSESLQKLPKIFITEVANYLKEKKEIALKEGDLTEISVKTKKQLENAMTLFNELILRRRKKMLNLVLIATETGISKQDFDNMLAMEKDLFEDLMKSMADSEKKLARTLGGEKKQEKKNELIIFKEDVEEFVGLDGEKMGGFEKGQIVNIPKEIAEILIDDKKAELFEG